MMSTVYVDRSRYETYVTDCQFKRWLKYHAYGQGIVPISKNIHLEIGISVHELIRGILDAEFESVGDFAELNGMIDAEFEEFDKRVENRRKEFQSRGFVDEGERAWSATKKEGKCLIEGLVKCWWMVELPQILSKYEIVSIEKDVSVVVNKNPKVVLLSRPDAILINKESGDYGVYSIKTARNVDERLNITQEAAMQNFTEIWAAAKMVNRNGQRIPKVWFVRQCNLIKGGSRFNEKDERYEFDSPWTRYWVKKEGRKASGPKRIAVGKYYDEYGNQKGLYWDAYDKKYVWKVKGGAREYFEKVKNGVVEPGEELIRSTVKSEEKSFFWSEVLPHLDRFVEGELEVLDKLKKVEKYWEDSDIDGVRMHFRPNYRSCAYPTPCEMLGFCENKNMWAEPWGKFEKRKPHHEKELIQIEKRKERD